MKILFMQPPIVSVKWLFENRYNPELIILDASLPKPMADPQEKTERLKIPGSIFFDIENVFSDKKSDLPHMMPSEESFTNEAQQLGINEDSIIIAYDNIGVYSAPRAWWMFLSMGHKKVYVLDGGLPEWEKAGYECDTTHIAPSKKGNFVAEYQPALITPKSGVVEALKNKNEVVIDARSPGRFAGKAPEPRKGLRSGHMPNAINVYFEQILNGNMLLEKAALEKVFEKIADKDQPIIFSCGSGITACITALGATVAGYNNLSVYDGSWCEWGLPSELPVVTQD